METDSLNRLEDNVPGPWFTTDDCIICGLCGEIAPETFAPDSGGVFHIVHHQPDSAEAEADAEEAREACPVEAIHRESEE